MTVEAYPLQWPAGWPITKYRENSRFKTTFAKARDTLFEEIRRLGGTMPVLSSNVELRRDGLPYANRIPHGSPGVAIYFDYKGQAKCFPRDKYLKVEDNIWALCKTIEALRGIERWGGSESLEAAFQGFEALPDQSNGSWWAVLGVHEKATPAEVDIAYRRARKNSHPDHGGNDSQFNAVQQAWQQYIEQRA